MASTSLRRSSLTGITKYDSMLAGNAFYDPEAHVLIATQTVSSTVASVTFSNIPQGYKHLEIRASVQNSFASAPYGGQGAFWTVNGDTTYTNYRSHLLWGNGSSVQSQSIQSSGWNGLYVGTTGGAGMTYAPSHIVQLLDYSSTSKYKTSRGLSGWDSNGSGEALLSSAMWMSTSAITSLEFKVYGYSISAGTFSLYGIKG